MAGLTVCLDFRILRYAAHGGQQGCGSSTGFGVARDTRGGELALPGYLAPHGCRVLGISLVVRPPFGYPHKPGLTAQPSAELAYRSLGHELDLVGAEDVPAQADWPPPVVCGPAHDNDRDDAR